MASPYMNLDLPVPGSTAGPAYASMLVAALTTLDAHDHSSGKGVPVRTSGLFVDSGLSFGGYDASALRSTRFTNHAAPLAGAADLGCLFVSGGELYFRDGSGNAIQFSASGALNTASLGAIGGDYSTSGASLAYASVSKLFSFESSAGVKAHAALGNLSIYEAVASGKAVTLRAPTGLAANYQLTLPGALPASTRLLSLDSSGNVAATAYLAADVARINEAQTWTAKPTFSADAAVTGRLTVTGQMYAGSVELVGAAAFVDFKDDSGEDLDARIIKATGANLAVTGTPLTVMTPVAATDAATKGYVDSLAPSSAAGKIVAAGATTGYGGGAPIFFSAGTFGVDAAASTNPAVGEYRIRLTSMPTNPIILVSSKSSAVMISGVKNGSDVLVYVRDATGAAATVFFNFLVMQGG